MQMLPGGRISMGGVTVSLLIQQAYQVRDFQVAGGPDWLRSDRYDVIAKPENAASPDQVRVMLQALLKDRFQLKFHRETKELPTYALVVAKGWPKLQVSKEAPPAEGEGRGRGGRGGQMRMMGRGHFEANGLPVSALANQLAQALGRSVIDKTGLTGNYDFKLDWTPDENQRGLIAGPGGEPAPAPTEGISIFTAVQDQLGLKLESTKGPVEILVIDGVERPSEN
jgi:uncharacterized protein (TIGR03435 family)